MITRRIINTSVGIIIPIALVLLWWFGSADSTNPFFPPLQTILIRFKELWLFQHFASDIVPSVLNLVIGFGLAVVIGMVLGFVFATVPVVRHLFEPTTQFLRGIPPVALIPILITLIGFGNDMRITTITIAAVFPTLLSTIDGIQSTEPQLQDVSKVYRLRRGEHIRFVLLPSALPQIMSGIQVSLVTSFVVMIGAEMLGSSQGIGAMTLLAQQSFLSADMWAGILLLAIIGFIANLLFELVKARSLRWYLQAKQLERQS